MRYSQREQRLPYLDKPLSKGALIFFHPRGMHAGSTDRNLAFAHREEDPNGEENPNREKDAREEWNECPAHQFAPELLKRIWVTAKRLP